jgi:protein TonB
MKSKLISICILLAFAANAYAQQSEKDTIADEEISQSWDVMPEFPGGEQALYTFLSDNIRYPLEAVERGVQGKVVVKFVVAKDGSIKNVKNINSVFPALDNEALRLIKSMPKWKAGTQEGVPVNVNFTLPITFKIVGNSRQKEKYEWKYPKQKKIKK